MKGSGLAGDPLHQEFRISVNEYRHLCEQFLTVSFMDR
jgi:hypothetical protein